MRLARLLGVGTALGRCPHNGGPSADVNRVKSHLYDIRLTGPEAVVLFELLQRIDEERPLDLAEHEVIDSLLNLLEGALTERVDHGYETAVTRAKQRLVSAI